MRKITSILILSFLSLTVMSQQADAVRYITKNNISYIAASEKDAYRTERCKLDVYFPENAKEYATIVWFHGGGLTGGEKGIPEQLKNKGVAVVAVNYRLSPKATHPSYIEDAATAVAWVFENIEKFGGSANKIFVSGHSAGGYLTLMIGLDKSYLAKHNIDADKIRGLIPISGQTNTHYTIKQERNLPFDIPLIDAYAPLNHARKGIPPTLLVSGDRTKELLARYEENAHLAAILKGLGNTDIEIYELEGFDHGNVYIPGCYLMIDWIKKYGK